MGSQGRGRLRRSSQRGAGGDHPGTGAAARTGVRGAPAAGDRGTRARVHPASTNRLHRRSSFRPEKTLGSQSDPSVPPADTHRTDNSRTRRHGPAAPPPRPAFTSWRQSPLSDTSRADAVTQHAARAARKSKWPGRRRGSVWRKAGPRSCCSRCGTAKSGAGALVLVSLSLRRDRSVYTPPLLPLRSTAPSGGRPRTRRGPLAGLCAGLRAGVPQSRQA